MTNRIRSNDKLMFKGFGKNVAIHPSATGRSMGHEPKRGGGAVPTKHRRKQWYEGLPKLKDGKYFSQKFQTRFKDEDYTYPQISPL